MTPPKGDEKPWQHQALTDVQEDFEEAHRRLRKELEEEKGLRQNLERKFEIQVEKLRDELKSEYFRKDLFASFEKSSFGPVQRAVYGTIGLITTAVILFIVNLVLKTK